MLLNANPMRAPSLRPAAAHHAANRMPAARIVAPAHNPSHGG